MGKLGEGDNDQISAVRERIPPPPVFLALLSVRQFLSFPRKGGRREKENFVLAFWRSKLAGERRIFPSLCRKNSGRMKGGGIAR